MLSVVTEKDVGRETRLECQLEEVVLRGHWRWSSSDIIMQRSLINTCAYLPVIKIGNEHWETS